MVYKSKVTVSAIVSGTVEAFDGDAYRSNMASLLEGVDPSDITLTVSAASVRIVAEIIAANDSIAESVVSTMQSYDSGAISAALGAGSFRDAVTEGRDKIGAELLETCLSHPQSFIPKFIVPRHIRETSNPDLPK